MPKQVVSGASLWCSMGTAPSSLIVLTANVVLDDNLDAANIMDHVPMMNIMPFGMCQAIANPTVAAATTAAMGVLTPMACLPNTPSPWTPGASTMLIDNHPALNHTSLCVCVWGGVINITEPGQMTTDIP